MGVGADGSIELPRTGRTARFVAIGAFCLVAAVPIVLLSMAATAGNHPPIGIREAVVREEAREPEPVWRSITTRHGGFDVDAPRWRPLGARTTVLRRSDGLAREMFQFGEATDGRRHAAIAVDRGEIAPAAAIGDINELALATGLSAQVQASPLTLDTKFGPLATVDMTVEGPDGAKACLGFALRAPEAGLRIAGWVCSAGPEIVNRVDAACFIDRLFAVGVRDGAVAAIFARAELKRLSCSANQAPLSVGASTAPDRSARPALRTGRL